MVVVTRCVCVSMIICRLWFAQERYGRRTSMGGSHMPHSEQPQPVDRSHTVSPTSATLRARDRKGSLMVVDASYYFTHPNVGVPDANTLHEYVVGALWMLVSNDPVNAKVLWRPIL